MFDKRLDKKNQFNITILPIIIFVFLTVFQAKVFGFDIAQSGKPKIFGRVVNNANQPIPDVRITAISMSNDSIRYALASETTTDKEGRYSFENAISGEEYSLEFFAAGYGYAGGRTLAGSGQDVIKALNPEPVHKLSGKVLKYLSGQSVVGTKVVLIGEKVYKNEFTITNEDGSFVFDNVPQNIGQGIIYAIQDDFCSEYLMVRATTTEIELSLKRSSAIKGIVTSDSGTPIAGSTVVAHPEIVSGFSVTQKTKEDGTYKFENLPAGRYVCNASHPTWFSTQSSVGNAVGVQPGQTYSSELKMYEKIPVEGRILGPDNNPVAGAYVASVSSGGSGGSFSKTDANGYFKLYSKELNTSIARGPTVVMEIAAIAEKFGIGKATVRKSRDNWELDNSEKNVVIKLNGRMRIFGSVKDSRGNPVPDVRVYLHPNLLPIVNTDSSGHYDLNWFDLPDKNFEVTFRAPRPDDGGVRMSIQLAERKAMDMPKQGTQYYLHQAQTVAPKIGSEMELNAVLASADLLTIHGKVTDNNGKPVVQASLMLFSGNAKEDEWRDKIDFYRRRGTGGPFGVDSIVFVPLARTVTDKEGNYTLCAVRENLQSLHVATIATKIDPNLYSFGVMSLNQVTKLITDIRPQPTENNKVIDIQLQVSP
jgi:protocatechuate 3,4-dioxygenase beta subunit